MKPEDMPVSLPATLQLAVPLHIERLRGRTADQLAATAHRCAQIVASEGDNLMFRAAKRGGTARVFNALAEGLAVLAHAPGGVDFAGLHWEVSGSPLDASPDLSGAVAAVAS